MERLELADLPPRNEGCRAVLFDDGQCRSMPKCMGGAVLLGCSNPELCVPNDDREIGYRTDQTGIVVYLWARAAAET